MSVRDAGQEEDDHAAQGQDLHRETEAIDPKMRWNGFLAMTIAALLACAAPAAADTVHGRPAPTTPAGFCSADGSVLDPPGARAPPGETPGPDTIQIPAGRPTQLSEGPLQITQRGHASPARARRDDDRTRPPGSRVFEIDGDDGHDLPPDRGRRRRDRRRRLLRRQPRRRSRAPSRSTTCASPAARPTAAAASPTATAR